MHNTKILTNIKVKAVKVLKDLT